MPRSSPVVCVERYGATTANPTRDETELVQGYDPDADEEARKAAVEKIREAWKK